MNDLSTVPQTTNGLSPDVLTPERIELLKRTVCRGASDDEFSLFVSVANRAGLDPFSRQIHAVRRGNQMTIQTGIDGYRLIAQRSGQYAGQDDVVYDTDEGAHPNKATCTVYRFGNGQRIGTTKTARWKEYAQESSPMWRKMPWAMLGKCAEALALRAAFPQELSGLYTSDEMDQAENIAPTTVNVALMPGPGSAASRVAKALNGEIVPPAGETPPDDDYGDIPNAAREGATKDILGVGRDDMAAVIAAAKELKFGPRVLDAMSADLPAALAKMADRHIEALCAKLFPPVQS